MNKINIIPAVFLLSLFFGCETKKLEKVITITNSTQLDRKNETVVVPVEEILTLITDGGDKEDLLIKDMSSGAYCLTQWIDYNQDGIFDELIFQVDIGPKQEKKYTVVYQKDGKTNQPKSTITTYSRFVPERTDDYAWENDKVAFRAFGPEAQRLIEANEPGGTLTSGIDLWLKKVDYSIIDSWYAKNVEEPGYYHIDHGEGHDPYHVGISRGTGGLGVWMDDSLHTSKNFMSYKTIATGPIRTVFELEYEDWSQFGITETKKISIDLGSNFSKIELNLSHKNLDPNYALGITLHEGKGEVNENAKQGVFSYWESINDDFLGTGLVISPKDVEKSFVNISDIRDQSHLLVTVKPKSELTYYIGFGWTGSKQVMNKDDWNDMLVNKSNTVANPLNVSFK